MELSQEEFKRIWDCQNKHGNQDKGCVRGDVPSVEESVPTPNMKVLEQRTQDKLHGRFHALVGVHLRAQCYHVLGSGACSAPRLISWHKDSAPIETKSRLNISHCGGSLPDQQVNVTRMAQAQQASKRKRKRKRNKI